MIPTPEERRAKSKPLADAGWKYVQPAGIWCRRCLGRETMILGLGRERRVYCPVCASSWSAHDLKRQREDQERMQKGQRNRSRLAA